MSKQKTLIFLKPDALGSTAVTCQIIERILNAGFHLTEGRLIEVSNTKILTHYATVIQEYGEPMRKKVLEFFVGMRVFVMVAERENAIQAMRDLIGATNPAKASPGTIRGDLSHDDLAKAMEEGRLVNNLIHASDSPESVEREIQLWLQP